MMKNKFNFWLDCISLVLMIVLVQTGVLMKYFLPPGSGHGPDGGPGMTILGWNRHGWGAFHWWLAAGLIGMMALHLALHWPWLVRMATSLGRGTGKAATSVKRKHYQSGLGFVLILILVMAGPLVWAGQNIQGSAVPHEHEHDDGRLHDSVSGVEFPHGDQRICGRLTLEQIARNTGIPGRVIIEKLNLPEDVATDTLMNQLGAQYGFSMPQLRDILNEWAERQ